MKLGQRVRRFRNSAVTPGLPQNSGAGLCFVALST